MLKRLPYTNTVIILGLFSMVAVFEPIRFLLTTDPLEDNDYVIKSSRHIFAAKGTGSPSLLCHGLE